MHIANKSQNRINLMSDKHRAGVRLDFDDKAKKWLVTAFEKNEGIGSGTRSDITKISSGDDTARPTADSENSVSKVLNKYCSSPVNGVEPEMFAVG